MQRTEATHLDDSAQVRPRHPEVVLDKKRTVVLLRSVVVISTSYLILFGGAPTQPLSIAYIMALIVSNIVLLLTPRSWFRKPSFSAALLLGDTAVVLVGLYLTVGCFSQDFLIIYFFTIFLTTATQGVAQIALGSAMISALYGYWLWISTAHALDTGEWLRLPFFFIVAVFYAYMTEETKHERWRRRQAERESDHLRLLLTIGNACSERTVSAEVVQQFPSLVEAVFPRLVCTMLTTPAGPPPGAGLWLPLHTLGDSFGSLRVTSKDGSALNPDEDQFCRILALTLANALFAAKQAAVAADGLHMKPEFLGTLSHELRTPLHAILGYTDILESVLAQSPEPLVHESLGRVHANACRLQDLFDEILCLAQLRSGEQRVEVAPLNLSELFATMADRVRAQLAGRPVTFDWEIGPGLAIVRTDPRKLQQILSGLLSNAVKFTDTGTISLNAWRTPEGELEIAVRDSGIGISPRDVDAIFEDFHQIDASLTRRFEGLGLGLALVRELTHALGGRVEVESQPKGGSVFRLRLPLADAMSAAAAPVSQTNRQAVVVGG